VIVIPGINLVYALQESAHRLEESQPRGHRHAEEILELCGNDEEPRAGREADHDRMRDEIDERAESRDSHRELQETHHQRERQHERDIVVRAGRCKRRHRREDDERHRIRRAGDLVPARTP
jgi:hypothetical protein